MVDQPSAALMSTAFSLATGSAFSSATAARAGKTRTPSDSRTLFSISHASCGRSFRKARIILTLADTFAVIAVPGTRLLDDLRIRTQIEDLAFARRAFSIKDVEVGFLERRRDLVLDDLDLGFVADHFVTRFDRAGAADVQAHGSVEFQGVTAGRRFRAAEHDADFHADLVDEDDQRVGAVDRAGQLAQRLRHQTRLQARQRIAHVAFDFGAWRQRGHRVDDDQVDAARADQRIADFQRLLTGVRLRDQQLVQVDAQLLRITDVERVFGIDEGAGATEFLHLGDGLQGQRGFTGRFRTVDFHHAAARQAADAERDVQAERAGRDDLHFFDRGAGVHAHHGPFAELLFDLRQCGSEGLGLLRCGYYAFFIVHNVLSSRLFAGSNGVESAYKRYCIKKQCLLQARFYREFETGQAPHTISQKFATLREMKHNRILRRRRAPG